MSDGVRQKAMRGFAVIRAREPARFYEIVSKGGASVPAHKRSYYKNRELAKESGQKGGLSPRKPKNNSQKPEI